MRAACDFVQECEFHMRLFCVIERAPHRFSGGKNAAGISHGSNLVFEMLQNCNILVWNA